MSTSDIIYADGETLEGISLNVVGNGNTVTGQNCRVSGDRNTVRGTGCIVVGDENTVTGAACRATGKDNYVTGLGSRSISHSDGAVGVSHPNLVDSVLESGAALREEITTPAVSLSPDGNMIAVGNGATIVRDGSGAVALIAGSSGGATDTTDATADHATDDDDDDDGDSAMRSERRGRSTPPLAPRDPYRSWIIPPESAAPRRRHQTRRERDVLSMANSIRVAFQRAAARRQGQQQLQQQQSVRHGDAGMRIVTIRGRRFVLPTNAQHGAPSASSSASASSPATVPAPTISNTLEAILDNDRASGDDDDEQLVCITCCANLKCVTLTPCGHISMCVACCLRLVQEADRKTSAAECPLCKEKVVGAVFSRMP